MGGLPLDLDLGVIGSISEQTNMFVNGGYVIDALQSSWQLDLGIRHSW